ncbi:histone-like nucleoid-structuring protein Lsr2 [Streptomyces sp. NPDC101455]|uniref:Lsr2 family DNA-binding protein n=1 Tax=Streptomyces sp. NPDC101455 TaxID=3366142 RepID=UPI00380D9D5A
MFTDMKEALEAEALELTPLASGQSAAASLVVAHQARDKDDLADLLGALGLPCGEDDLVTLLPHLTAAAATPTTGALMPVNAFTATAISMLDNGDSPEHVREVLGLSETELAAAVQQAEELTRNTDTPDTDSGQTDDPSAPEPDTARAGQPVPERGIEALLAWGEQHTAKGVQALAAKARTALAELAGRRETEQAVTDAEDRVARLQRELTRAKEELKEAKTGKPATDAVTDTLPKAVVTANLPATGPGAGAGGKRSKEELAAIRTWAREHGHEVADRGNPAQKVIDAYYAAQTVMVGADS